MEEFAFEPVRVKNIHYSDLLKLSKSVRKHAGSYMLQRPSGGPGTPAVDAICRFPSLDDTLQFKAQWAGPDDD